MYDELVKRLHRYSENCVAYKLDADFADAVQRAADAIGELQKRVEFEHQSGFADGQIAANRRKPHWIPVTERLPESEGRYLAIFYEEMIIDFGYYRPSVGWCEQGITHWMPLPEPPKEEI